MQVQSVSNQSFGGIKCKPDLGEIIVHIASKSSYEGTIKGDRYLKRLKDNHALTNLYLTGNSKKQKLCASVGGKTFKENWLYGPLTVLKKALNVSDKIEFFHNCEAATRGVDIVEF